MINSWSFSYNKTTASTIISLVYVLLLSLALFLTTIPFHNYTPTLSSTLTDIVHYRWNAWLPWKVDDILASLPTSTIIYAYYLVFGLGLAVLLRNLPLAAACTLLISAYWQGDIIITGALAWSTFLAASVLYLLKTKTPSILPLMLFFALRVAKSGLYLAPFILVVIFITTLISNKGKNTTLLQTLFILCLIPVTWVTWQLPSPSPLDYPQNSTVLPLNGVADTVRPLVGYDTPVHSINYTEVSNDLWLISIVLLVATLILYKEKPENFTATLFLGLLVLLDLFLPPAMAQISPLAALMRIIPGSYLFPIQPILISLLTILVLNSARYCNIRTFSLVLLLLTLPCLIQRRSPSLVQADSPWAKALLSSPSRSLSLQIGHDYLAKGISNNIGEFKSIGSEILTSTVSANSEMAQNMFDNDGKTRWYTTQAMQQSTDAIYFKFKSKLHVNALKLQNSPFAADFPRGLEVLAPSNCSLPSELYLSSNYADYKLLFSQRDWLGNIAFTNSKLPYLTSQEDPIIFINDNLECLVIKRVGAPSRFDWSIAEVQFN